MKKRKGNILALMGFRILTQSQRWIALDQFSGTIFKRALIPSILTYICVCDTELRHFRTDADGSKRNPRCSCYMQLSSDVEIFKSLLGL